MWSIIFSVTRFMLACGSFYAFWRLHRYFRSIPENDSMEPHTPYLKKHLYAITVNCLLLVLTYLPELIAVICDLIQEIGK